ncbi:MAG: hypothetical protein J0L92_24090 [Deltaproteobacteria bacterium]|nr:hypothetical protein [Deltaproteobacteria bacterium]
MKHERILALLVLVTLVVALAMNVAVESPIELALALATLALGALFASRRGARFFDRPALSSSLVRGLVIGGPIVIAAAIYLGGPRRWDDMGLRGDWPVNEAFVHAIRDAIVRGRPFTWSTLIAPGDPTTELYPTLAHRLLAHLSYAWPDVPLHRIVVGAAVIAFVSVAIGVARAARITGAPWQACVLVGLACLYDYGSDFGWGARATFFWGFFPSTLAMGVWYATLPSALEALKRPTRTRLFLVALGFGAAAILHPVGLVLSGSLVVAAVLSMGLARGPERTRVASVFVALAAGIALTAPIWAPASQRVLDHGVHFGTPPVPIESAGGRMAQGLLPDGSFIVLVLLGWMAVVRGLFARRTGPTILAIAALFLVSLYIETYFLDLGFAPSITSVRWQSFRVGTFLKPVLYVLAAHSLGAGASLVLSTPSRRARWTMRASALVVLLAIARLLEADPVAWITALEETRQADITGHELADREAFLALREHLERERAAIPEGEHARLLLFCPLDCPYELMAIAWDPGIPLLLHHPAPAGHFLRDQFFDTSPANLRRFGVRWALAVERTPPPGDVASERRFGNLVLRDVPDWDGSFAHVVEGEGTVRVEVVEGEGYDLIVEGGPARVELGTPYYPRLRASLDGHDVPVEPLPVHASPEGALDPGERAVALDLSPGRTRLRANGALRSDGAGRGLFVIAALGLVALGILRVRGDPPIARLRARLAQLVASAWPGRVVLAAALAVIAAVPFTEATSRALRFGVLMPRPRMHLEDVGGENIPCEPRSLGRRYVCGEVEVSMTVATVLQDWHVGWPVPVPAIEVRGAPRRSTFVIETDAPLTGEYLGACASCSASIERGESQWPFGSTGTRVPLPDEPGTSIVRAQIHASIARIALVRASLVLPPE